MAIELDTLEDSADDLPPWRRTVPIVLAVLLALALGMIVFLADRAAEQRDRAIGLQRHSFEVMLLASDLEGTIANAEALLARYVVSLDQKIGRQYLDEWRTAQAEIQALERATRGNPIQRANVADLKQALDERGKSLSDIALRTTYKQRAGAIGRFYAAGKSPIIERMRQALKRTVEQEKVELARRNMAVDRSEDRVSRFNDSYALLGLGLLAGALLALWFAYGAMRERRFARRLATAEAARVDALESAVRQRTAELQTANAKLHREIEERARAEQSVRQLQKMEAIGKLTGGIAHDFNNMLAVVVSGIDLARQTLKRDIAKTRRHLDSAMDGATRAAALTSRLLAFARPEPSLGSQVDADALVAGMRDLLGRAIGEGVTLELALDAGDWHLWIEQTQLENALLNLAINARDAMDGRGTLTIATARLALSEGEIGQCAAGDYVAIGVTDTGSGMSPAVIERAFEPFFTTKPVGKGTGLGLSQIFSFVRQAHGEIEVQSIVGQGTTFRLILPRERPAAETSAADDLAALWVHPVEVIAAGDGPETAASDGEEPGVAAIQRAQDSAEGPAILVVEDDVRVLRATLAALKELGYRGLSCDHPRKAAALLARHPDIALILSDVMMPDMTGPEMIAALGGAVGNRPVIFVTGYAGEGERTAQLAGLPMLRKPFTLAQLRQAIDAALGGVEPDPAPVQG